MYLYPFFVIGLLVFCFQSNAQTVHVKYKKFIVPGNTEYGRWMSSPEMRRNMREREEQMASNVSDYYDLHSNGVKSYFEYDTTIHLKEIKDERRGWWRMGNDMRFSHAKDLQNGNVTIRSELLADSVCRSVNFKEKYKWKVAEGEKIFANLRCQRAYHINDDKDTITVWFAQGIPVIDGPEEFAGAPGLILAVEAPAFNYIAEEVKVGEFEVPKQAIESAKCLSEKAFQDKVREEMMRKYLQEE